MLGAGLLGLEESVAVMKTWGQDDHGLAFSM